MGGEGDVLLRLLVLALACSGHSSVGGVGGVRMMTRVASESYPASFAADPADMLKSCEKKQQMYPA